MNLPNFTDGKEGVFYDLPDADYRKAPGVSNSMLKNIALDGDEPGSPAHFAAAFHDPTEDTDALFFGRMVHSRILTPCDPLPGIVAYPETYTNEKGEIKPWSGNAKVCKAWIEAQEAAGLRPMKPDAIRAMDGVVNAITKDTTCEIAFRNGKAEVSVFKQHHTANGMVLRKARMDWVPPGPALVDIKTCQDARACEFDRVLWSRRYYVQAAFYLDLWNECNPDDKKDYFVFVVVEKSAPHAIQLFAMDPTDIESGRREYRRNLSLVIQCINSGEWPGYPQGVQPIKMREPSNRKSLLPETT